MKVLTKNLEGQLQNGQLYKIRFHVKKRTHNPGFMLSLVFSTTEDEDWGWWYHWEYSSVTMFEKGQYHEAIRNALIELENKSNIKLLELEL